MKKISKLRNYYNRIMYYKKLKGKFKKPRKKKIFLEFKMIMNNQIKILY